MKELAHFLDSRFQLGPIRVGWDAILGLIPGFGDAITSVLSAYIVLEAAQAGLRPAVLVRMVANVLIENIVGAVPIAGDAFDVFWRANEKNYNLYEAALKDGQKTQRLSVIWLLGLLLAFIVLSSLAIAIPLALAIYLVRLISLS
ncbi:MAG: DUF4112 domain-containing protein [Bdellovibrionales bacterium]|nr:DUF4112 domain-containing protein [Bdellovibrionales bacterium]